MRHRRFISTASLLAVITAVGFVATDRAPAADAQVPEMQVISSDATARFIPLELSKLVVIDLPSDIKDVLVADPGIVHTFVLTKRRISIIGVALGETNVYFFDAGGRQIGALDISVVGYPNESSASKQVVVIFRGPGRDSGIDLGKFSFLSCTGTMCIGAEKGEAANTAHSDITYHNKP
jgi:hypothetical protein